MVVATLLHANIRSAVELHACRKSDCGRAQTSVGRKL